MKIGILREEKIPEDKRVPITPNQCKKLLQKYPSIELFIQSSRVRCFADNEYTSYGINIIDDIYYQPTCPLCRTIITSININEYFSYLYFKSTFSEEFIPDYFNQINENQLEKIHIYEEKYYYRNQVVEFNDDDMEYSPYSLYIPTNMYVFNKIREFIRTNIIIYRILCAMIGCVFLFCILA